MIKLDILAFGAHPDDVEISCSGTLIKHVAAGYKVGVIDLTRGELGTRGSVAIRDEECQLASTIMGIHARENLNLADGFFEINEASKMKVVQVIRKYRPSIVLANTLDDRHPDHGRAAKLVAESAFLAGLRKINSQDELGNDQEAWRPKAVYHYVQDWQLKPDFIVDITGFTDKRMESLLAYKSQFYNPNSKEPETPISSQAFLNMIVYRSLEMGRIIGAEHGEAFKIHRPIGVRHLMDLL
jgi:bacillithiol biosynthesis deacetylase BshB1